MIRAGAPVTALAAAFGVAVSLAIGCLWLYRRKVARAQQSPAG